MAKKPKPVPVSLVCSMCGQDWGKHGDEPTLETCIEVLRAELASRPRTTYTYGGGLIANPGSGSVTLNDGLTTSATSSAGDVVGSSTLYLIGEQGPESVAKPININIHGHTNPQDLGRAVIWKLDSDEEGGFHPRGNHDEGDDDGLAGVRVPA